MAFGRGTVERIEITEDSASVKIAEDDGMTSTWVVWSDYLAEYTALQRLVHGQWLSLLRTALTGGNTVTIVSDPADPASNLIYQVTLER